MSHALRVGIIGLNAERGWAREAHAPAILATPGLELAAVATRSTESAKAAAAAFGIPRAYGDAAELITDPDIDVVAVVSAVPTHENLILASFDAGKHVVTEWPVAIGTPATDRISDAAAAAGVATAVGLQARMNPAAQRAATLIREGRIGSVRTIRVFSSTAAFGPSVGEADAALEDEDAGMNLTTIQTAHTLDLVSLLGGALHPIHALRSIQFPRVTIGETGRVIDRTMPDQVMVLGRLPDGGSAIVEIVGGRSESDSPFTLQVDGSEGTIVLSGGAPRGFQSGVLDLTLNGEPVETAPRSVAVSVVNVAGVYGALRDDVLDGTATAPTFHDAVHLSRVIDRVARDGESVLSRR